MTPYRDRPTTKIATSISNSQTEVCITSSHSLSNAEHSVIFTQMLFFAKFYHFNLVMAFARSLRLKHYFSVQTTSKTVPNIDPALERFKPPSDWNPLPPDHPIKPTKQRVAAPSKK